ncbi:hypothetical protein H634G_10254 [Metarhizium anisopliae BRIP 53293]|uniref:Phytanoyl-CoA dioxygenase n=1 Tax=Metarhizium anisopliae BRIP 53293 TaxID=1291518 RepID=A0A0D9NJV0_METAN|nr:hypothetical protein H634G_10254 [Metarhizium anisopliae BRIP 53293]KJK92458.1 hypothetical protein H633G_03658 [Metarhizium anisopliae BRIP 53284]
MDQPPELFPTNYKPSIRIAELSANAPIEEILSVIDRDGGVIINGLVSSEELESIEKEIEMYTKADRSEDEGFFKDLVPQETILIGGLVGKSDTTARICEHPVLEQLRTHILTDVGTRRVEKYDLPYHIDPLLSVSLSFRIQYGAPRQRLHRDDGTHLIEHESKPYKLNNAAQFGCLIAGVETTQENGATMFIPGSHRWDDKREPRLDEVTFAEMKPGAALIFLASCWHGAGHNSVPGFTRVLHGLFFCRGTYRTQENQFLAIPRSKALSMSPKMLNLLGYKQPGAALGMVENADPMLDLEHFLREANL